MQRLVVCADGTWNSPKDPYPTNVVGLYDAIDRQERDGVTQKPHYNQGVGTELGFFKKYLGGAFGLGISDHVKDCYAFLVANYQPNDEIYLFGFSRGAFTVRSLAGMIRNVGLLKQRDEAKEQEAYRIYTRRDGSADTPEAIGFREANSWPDVAVKFIGVLDTVGSLGIPGFFRFLTRRSIGFHDMRLSRMVGYAYQALAIDENRGSFPAAVWLQHPQAPDTQVLEQAWFPGDHSDVGGGWQTHQLSNCTLRWLADRAIEHDLVIDEDRLRLAFGPFDPDPLGTVHDPRQGIWTWLPEAHRKIGVGGPPDAGADTGPSREQVAGDAKTRHLKMETYRPRNLETYLKEHPEALG